jgi:hypothetical protein
MGQQLPAEAAAMFERLSREALSKGTFLGAMRHLRDSLNMLTEQVTQLVDRIEASEQKPIEVKSAS